MDKKSLHADYSPGKVLFESHMRMVFNEVPGKKCVFLFFQVSEETMDDFRFWIENDAWRVSFCFSSLYIAAVSLSLTQLTNW